MPHTILVVDDKANIREMLRKYLTQDGFDVVEAANGRDAIYMARDHHPDLIILDLMMPEMGGYEFMSVYGREADTPIIILTAKIEETDRVLGLELGADDYVTKPFSLREITARIRAVLRRATKSPSDVTNGPIQMGNLTIDPQARLVYMDSQRIDLTPSEFGILAVLMQTPGRAFSRLELLERIGDGVAYEGAERSIDVHIRNLRLKVEPDPSKPSLIETVYGLGYRCNPDTSA